MNVCVINKRLDSVSGRSKLSDELAEEILKAIRDIRFGSVEVIVHDGRVTEIRQTRRRRVPASAES